MTETIEITHPKGVDRFNKEALISAIHKGEVTDSALSLELESDAELNENHYQNREEILGMMIEMTRDEQRRGKFWSWLEESSDRLAMCFDPKNQQLLFYPSGDEISVTFNDMELDVPMSDLAKIQGMLIFGTDFNENHGGIILSAEDGLSLIQHKATSLPDEYSSPLFVSTIFASILKEDERKGVLQYMIEGNSVNIKLEISEKSLSKLH